MARISGNARSQRLFLPDAVDDWEGADNPVRFLDTFVDGLDLERASFERVQANRTRPRYDSADLLKPYLYGYLDRRVPRSAWRSRRLLLRTGNKR